MSYKTREHLLIFNLHQRGARALQAPTTPQKRWSNTQRSTRRRSCVAHACMCVWTFQITCFCSLSRARPIHVLITKYLLTEDERCPRYRYYRSKREFRPTGDLVSMSNGITPKQEGTCTSKMHLLGANSRHTYLTHRYGLPSFQDHLAYVFSWLLSTIYLASAHTKCTGRHGWEVTCG